MNDIMKMVQTLEDFNILLRGVTKTIKNETKEQKGWFLSMLLNTLGASLLGNILAGKGIIRASSGNKKEKRKSYSRNNLPKKIKDGAYLINLDDYGNVDTHWIVLFCNRSKIAYFDSSGVEHVPEETKKFVRNKNIIANIFRV